MVEQEIDFVKVQPRKAGNFMVTIPKEAVKALKLRMRLEGCTNVVFETTLQGL